MTRRGRRSPRRRGKLHDLTAEQPDCDGVRQFMHQNRRRHGYEKRRLLGQVLLGPGQWLLPQLRPAASDLDDELDGAADVQQGKEVEETRKYRHQQTSGRMIAEWRTRGKLAAGGR